MFHPLYLKAVIAVDAIKGNARDVDLTAKPGSRSQIGCPSSQKSSHGLSFESIGSRANRISHEPAVASQRLFQQV